MRRGLSIDLPKVKEHVQIPDVPAKPRAAAGAVPGDGERHRDKADDADAKTPDAGKPHVVPAGTLVSIGKGKDAKVGKLKLAEHDD